MKKGKKYVESAKLVDRAALYDVDEAVSLIKQTAKANFDERVLLENNILVVRLILCSTQGYVSPLESRMLR